MEADDERGRLLAELIENPQEREYILSSAKLGEADRDEIVDLIETADAVWLSAHGAPALENDPAAALLGLIPDPACRIESSALARARKRAHLKASDLATRLHDRGWEVKTSDVFRWETRTAVDVPPAMVQAVADILGAPVDSLIASFAAPSAPDNLASVRRDPRFNQLVVRWAAAQRVSPAVAAAALERRIFATVHRGDLPDTDQVMQSLQALVRAVEGTQQK